MALNHLKIDYFKKNFGGDRELNVLQKYFWSILIKFFPLGGMPSAITYHPLPVFLDTNYARNEIFILRASQPAAIG